MRVGHKVEAGAHPTERAPRSITLPTVRTT